MSAERGDWMRTFGGGRFYPADPRPEDVTIESIASGLSKDCRYAGQLDDIWYSVAEHSILVASILPDHLRLQGLLHDAPEAWLRDIPRPVKLLIPQYQKLEAMSWDAVAKRFGLPLELDPLVKWADDAVLAAEKIQLIGEDTSEWNIKAWPADVVIECLEWRDAQDAFLDYFNFITKAQA